MRRFLIASMLIVAAAASTALFPPRGWAQGQSEGLQLPGYKPLPPAPIKLYKPVAVTPPAADSDPSFVAFRKNLGSVVVRKDKAALARLVVGQGFFWMQYNDVADKDKPGIDNLARAVALDAKDGSGWEVLAGYAAEPTASPLPGHAGVICAPGGPSIDPEAFQALVEETRTGPGDWGYPAGDDVEVRSAAQPNAPVIDKLGMNLVRVLPDSAPPANADQPMFLHVATPSGKSGFVPAEAILGLGGDEMCYAKNADGWKITGYFGGAAE